MKLNILKKLNEKGFDHLFVAIFFLAIFAGIGTFVLVDSHAATYPHVCDYESIKLCLTTVNTSTGTTVDGFGYESSTKYQEFTIEKLSEMCNAGKVSSNCPFTVGSGLNNKYKNDEIDQFVYNGNPNAFDCLGSISSTDDSAGLQPCNTFSGKGGGTGTVFVRNIAHGGGTAGFVESKYWSNINFQKYHEYDSPAWLCFIQGGNIGLDGPGASGTCQWKQY